MLCPISQVCLGSILSLLWSVVCAVSPALSSACLFKIYCTTETCKFYDSRDSNLYSPFNENYPSYFFFNGKRLSLNCLLTVFTPSSFKYVFHVVRNTLVPSLPLYPNLSPRCSNVTAADQAVFSRLLSAQISLFCAQEHA